MQSSMERPQVITVNTMQAYFSTSALPPTGLEVSLNPQLRPPQASTLTLALAEELTLAPAFQPVVITTLMSANQRLTRGQEDSFVSAASITEQPVFVEPKDERVSEEL